MTPAKQILGNGGVWLLGYGLMWIAKMVLTSILTSDNTIQSAFGSLFYNTGIKGAEKVNLVDLYLSVYNKIKETVFTDGIADVFVLIGIVLLAAILAYRLYKGTLHLRDFAKYKTILLIAAFPIIWFVIAARPLINHYYFQYRSIAAVFWAIGGYLCLLWKEENRVVTTNNEKNAELQ